MASVHSDEEKKQPNALTLALSKTSDNEKESESDFNPGLAYSDGAPQISLAEAKLIIHQAIDGKQSDPNFDQELLQRATAALADAEDSNHHLTMALVEELKLEAILMKDSPYLEVRSVVSGEDDPEMFVNTFRAWFIGLVFAMIGTGINVFFSARNPGIVVNTFCAQVLSYPIAKAMEKVLPTRSWTMFGHKMSLNPGKFTVKEHMLITIMANVTFGGITGVYSTDIIFVQRLPQFFNQPAIGSNAGYQILLTLSTQLIGFGMAGLSRRFLVYPPAMIWPVNLATIALNRSFHTDLNPVVNGWKISRLRFFCWVFLGYGMYFVLPDAICSFLSYFNWMTWISPNNVKLAIFTGSISGLGLSPFTTFDWSYLSALNNPLITPWFSTLNLYIGAACIGLTMIPSIYFTNTWYTAYLPINSNQYVTIFPLRFQHHSHIYDNTGHRYNISSVLNSDFTLNVARYEAYSPVYQTAGYATVFFSFFAVYTATIVYIGLNYRAEVKAGFQAVWGRLSARDAYDDVHNRLMKRYKEVPEWWFGLVLGISIIFGIVCNEVYHTQLPVWAIFFCVLLGAIFLIPVGIIVAVTNVEVTLNVMAEIIGGFALPGKPLAVMIFKTYGFISVAQAVSYAGDMKLFTCPGYSTFFTSACQWGAVGPARLYVEGKLYYALTFGFLAGALSPIIPYYLAKRYPNSFWKYVNVVVLWYGGINWSPYNLSYLTPAMPLAWYFQSYLRQRYSQWWAKYNYILATALTSAISIFGVIWFFAILYNNYQPDWWGNNVPFDGCDAKGCPLLKIPAIGYFGPAPTPIPVAA